MLSVRYDWYQSETHVVVTVLLKNAADKKYAVNIKPDHVELTAEDYTLSLKLCKPINVEGSSHKATPSKVEIKLAKLTGERWDSLEKKEEAPAACAIPKKLPHNWDKISKEIEKQDADEPKGEEAVQDLFKKIYADSNEDTRKAMMKSFYESGGTVLSTNWKEVGAAPVDVKPPDGCEFKKWN